MIQIVRENEKRFEKEEKAFDLGIFFGLVGGIICLIPGLSSTTTDEIIQFDQLDDIIKFKIYAKCYFQNDQTVEEQYVELNVDQDQDITLRWDVKGMSWIKFQMQAGTAATGGGTAGTLDSCLANLVRDGG